MNRPVFLLPVLLAAILTARTTLCASPVVAGYLTASPKAEYDWDTIQYDALTHIIQAFVCPVSGSDPTLAYNGDSAVFQAYRLEDKSYFGYGAKLIETAHAKGVKVILGLAGRHGMDAHDLRDIFAEPRLMDQFVTNVVTACATYGYDGVDLDYEYPSSADEASGILRFTALLRSAFRSDARFHGREMTITLACPKLDGIGRFFDFAALSEYCDWFNIMTYAYEAKFTQLAGHNCPLFVDPVAAGAGRDISVDKSMWEYFHRTRGVPLEKLVVGLGFYGWVHRDAVSLYGAKSASLSVSYSDVVTRYLGKPGYQQLWSEAAQVPYLINQATREIVTYDDPRSIGIKCDYAREKGFRGVMIWELSRGCVFGAKPSQPLLATVGERMFASPRPAQKLEPGVK